MCLDSLMVRTLTLGWQGGGEFRLPLYAMCFHLLQHLHVHPPCIVALNLTYVRQHDTGAMTSIMNIINASYLHCDVEPALCRDDYMILVP